MGAEVGATTSIFPFDEKSAQYLESTGRKDVADEARRIMEHLQPDPEVLADPAQYYDQLIEIDLSELEPHINGPFTPDAAYTISGVCGGGSQEQLSPQDGGGLIGSRTNSSYEDLTRAVSIVQHAREHGVPVKAQFLINPLGTDTLHR